MTLTVAPIFQVQSGSHQLLEKGPLSLSVAEGQSDSAVQAKVRSLASTRRGVHREVQIMSKETLLHTCQHQVPADKSTT